MKSLLKWTSLLAGVAAGVWWLRSKRLRRSPQRLLCAIIGNDKLAVTAALGAPSASAGFGNLSKELAHADLSRGDTWYYPLDRIEQTALVVQFRGDIARVARLLRVPGR